MAAEALHGFGAGALVLRRDVAPLLRIEPRCDLRRTDQVAEQHRELAALAYGEGVGCRLWGVRTGRPVPDT